MSVLSFEDDFISNSFGSFQEFSFTSMDELLSDAQNLQNIKEDMYMLADEAFGFQYSDEDDQMFSNASGVVYGHDYSVESSITLESNTGVYKDVYANSGFYFGGADKQQDGLFDVTSSSFCAMPVGNAYGERGVGLKMSAGDMLSGCATVQQPHQKKSRYEAVEVTPLVPPHFALCLADTHFATESPQSRDYIDFVVRDFLDNQEVSYSYCKADSTWRAAFLGGAKLCEFTVSLYTTDATAGQAACHHVIEMVQLHGDKDLFNQLFSGLRGSLNHDGACGFQKIVPSDQSAEQSLADFYASAESRQLLAAQIHVPLSTEECSARNDNSLHQQRADGVSAICALSQDKTMLPLLCELGAVPMLLSTFLHFSEVAAEQPHLDNALLPLALAGLQNLMLGDKTAQEQMARDAGLLRYLQQRVARSVSEAALIQGSAPVQMAVLAKQVLTALFKSHRDELQQLLGVTSTEDIVSAAAASRTAPPQVKQRTDVLSTGCLLARGITADMSRIQIGAY